MTVIITITSEPVKVDGTNKKYDYSTCDMIVHDMIDDIYNVFYSGQNQGRLDHQLLTALDNTEYFKIYYRKKTSPYTYLGATNNVRIKQDRTVEVGKNSTQDERLQLHMCVSNIENIKVPENKFTGPGRYKKDILVHSGLRDIHNNIIIGHNKNTNIGFYYY